MNSCKIFRISGNRCLRVQARLFGLQVRPMRGRLSTIPRLHALPVRLSRYPPCSRLRGWLSVQGARYRRILRSLQDRILRPDSGQSRRMPAVRLFRYHRRVQSRQALLRVGEYYNKKSYSRISIIQIDYTNKQQNGPSSYIFDTVTS